MNRTDFGCSIRKKRFKLQPGDYVLVDGVIKLVKEVHYKAKRVMVDSGRSIAVIHVELLCYGKGLFY